MSIGAAVLCLPMAALPALYACLFQGTPAIQGLALYSLLGTSFLFWYALFLGTVAESRR